MNKEKQSAIKVVNNADLNSPVLPGAPLSIQAFKAWIAAAEQLGTISLKDAKKRWAIKKEALKSYECAISVTDSLSK